MRAQAKTSLLMLTLLLSNSAQSQDDITVMGIGITTCKYWHARVFRKAINMRELSSKATIYPYTSYNEWLNDKDGAKAYDEALDWISGYFAAAQRYANKAPKNKNQVTSEIASKVFDVCQKNPEYTFEKATHKALQNFFK